MKTFNQFISQTHEGGYFGARLTYESQKYICDWLRSIGIENHIMDTDLHVTIMYDKSNPNLFANLSEARVYNAKIIGVKEMGKKESEWFSIALMLDSDDLKNRYDELKLIGFKSSYEAFLPHLSLKYKPTEQDIELIKKNINKLSVKNIQLTDEWRERCNY